MILIPDIHINAKYGNKILTRLEELFAKHQDEEVIFLGDYVYMFSYDRSYLLKLFKLFISLCKEGRKVKIMAGNHDWIQDQFVFEEGKHLREMFEAGENTMKGSLQFITQPTHWVDNDTLHVVIPYNDRLEEPSESEFYNPGLLPLTQQKEIWESTTGLLQSAKKGEKLSGLLNTIALTYYETNKNKYKKIVLYHHYYTANKFFPGVNTQFHFRDAAIHPKFLELEGLMLISGHIHEPFSFQNYLCCGSFWHTSSLEKNEAKYYFVGDVNKWFEAYMTHINPKISFEVSWEEWDQGEIELTEWQIQENIRKVLNESKNNLQSSFVPNIYDEILPLAVLDVSLQTAGSTSLVKVEEVAVKLHHIDIRKIDNYMPKDQFNSIIESDFRSSFSDRKQLLSEYLHHKYEPEHDSLIDFLHNYNIIWKNTLDSWQ